MSPNVDVNGPIVTVKCQDSETAITVANKLQSILEDMFNKKDATNPYFSRKKVTFDKQTFYWCDKDGEISAVDSPYSLEDEFYVWKLEDWTGDVVLYDLIFGTKQVLPADKNYFVVSIYENLSYDSTEHIYNDQIVYFAEIKDKKLYIHSSVEEGGFCIIKNYDDLEDFAEWYAEPNGVPPEDALLGNEKLLKMYEKKQVERPFIIQWGV